jgi:hypothetical protein
VAIGHGQNERTSVRDERVATTEAFHIVVRPNRMHTIRPCLAWSQKKSSRHRSKRSPRMDRATKSSRALDCRRNSMFAVHGEAPTGRVRGAG